MALMLMAGGSQCPKRRISGAYAIWKFFSDGVLQPICQVMLVSRGGPVVCAMLLIFGFIQLSAAVLLLLMLRDKTSRS